MNKSMIAIVAGVAGLGGAGLLAGWSNAESGVEARELVFETRAGERMYQPDPTHTTVLFKIRHGGVANFYGRFNDMNGEVHYNAESPMDSRMAFTVQTASIDTNNASRDGHLRQADFFNARQFGEISFESTGITKSGDGYTLNGNLTLQGETRPISATLDGFTTNRFMDSDRLGFEATFTIKRSEFGMTKYLAPDGGEGGGLGNMVELTVAVEAIAE
ncbi:MAG: YceI family protein [Phycisphaerales bacterium]